MNPNASLQLPFRVLEKALNSLHAILKKPLDEDRSTVDATIQRFEYTIELYWKLLKKIIASQGQEVQFPKEILRVAYSGKLIEDESLWLSMLFDRNQTSHTYDEELADKIYNHIQQYYPVMQKTFEQLKQKYLN